MVSLCLWRCSNVRCLVPKIALWEDSEGGCQNSLCDSKLSLFPMVISDLRLGVESFGGWMINIPCLSSV